MQGDGGAGQTHSQVGALWWVLELWLVAETEAGTADKYGKFGKCRRPSRGLVFFFGAEPSQRV